MLRRSLGLAAMSAAALVVSATPAVAETWTTTATGCAPGIGAPHYICAKTQFSDTTAVRSISQVFTNGTRYCVIYVELDNAANQTLRERLDDRCETYNFTHPTLPLTRTCNITEYRAGVTFTLGSNPTREVAYTGFTPNSGCINPTAVKASPSADSTNDVPTASFVNQRTQDLVAKGKKTGQCLRDAGFEVEELPDGGGHTSYQPSEEQKFRATWKLCKL